jgi:nitrogen regulatory protein PII
MEQSHYSLVTAILPKETAHDIIKKAVPETVITDLFISARGAVQKEKWYQNLAPTINPEQTIVEMLVRENDASVIMNNIANEAALNSTGSGAVYSIKCDKTVFLSGDAQNNLPESSAPVSFKSNLTGIFCIIQKNMAEKVAITAMRSGSPGPTIVFGQGKGVREKLGILRIAISPEKEMIRVVVDQFDADHVFDAMVKEGKLDTPAMGFIYTMPVEKAIVNIAGITAGRSQLATNQEIIKAIDELKGGSSWRTHGAHNDHRKERKYLLGLSRLSCVVERGKGEALTQAALNNGAPAASITYGIKRNVPKQEGESGIAVNREMEIIEMTVGTAKVDEIITAMTKVAESEKNTDIYFYSQPVPKALTYLG